MQDQLTILTKWICQQALQLEKGEKLYISYGHEKTYPLLLPLIKEASSLGVFVYSELQNTELEVYKRKHVPAEQISTMQILEEAKIDFFDAFIYIKYSENDYESNALPLAKKTAINTALAHSVEVRANQKKWVLLNYPSVLDAYKSAMSYQELYAFALEAMTIDYQQLQQKIKPLKDLMEATDRVHIIGPGTDLTFSIKGMPAIPCLGEKNIPDGEIYTAPVKESVEGTITYNTPSPYQGNIYHHVSLTFANGQIIKATSDEEKDLLTTIFATDPGARYVGEFSLGLNKKITKPMGDILYDEKIFGSIHFTPGAAYDDCDNGNKSAVHWDLVLIQTENFGGGEIYFDDVLIRKDGYFVLPALQALNE